MTSQLAPQLASSQRLKVVRIAGGKFFSVLSVFMRSHTVNMDTLASKILEKVVGVELIRSFGEHWSIECSRNIDRAQTRIFRQFPETPESREDEESNDGGYGE